MAIHVLFEKERMADVIVALGNGRAIQPSADERWTADDLLALAGACMCVVLSHGPQFHRNIDVTKTHPEHREAIDLEFFGDVHSAIEWVSSRCFDVVDGDYDDHFEPIHELSVIWHDGRSQIIPQRGFKCGLGDEHGASTE